MKQIKKLSLSNVISKLTRNEMRYVMAGSGVDARYVQCCDSNGNCGTCVTTAGGGIPSCSAGYTLKDC
jgi:hypothetical protein